MENINNQWRYQLWGINGIVVKIKIKLDFNLGSDVPVKWKWSHLVVSDSLRPVDYSPPSSFIHGILQARILEWVAISFSRGSSQPRDRTQVSHIAGRNTVSQKTSYSDTELQIQVLTSKISREERNPGWRRGMRLGKRGDLTDISCHQLLSSVQLLWSHGL